MSNIPTIINTSAGPASSDPLGLNNPTPIILALVNKIYIMYVISSK